MTHDTDFDRLVRLSSWARRMGAMLGAGVCLLRALRVAEQTEEEETFRAALQDLGDRVEHGETLSAAMRSHPEAFGDLAVSMVRAGEYGGVLDETVEAWADLLRRDIELSSRTRLYRLLAQTAEAAGVQSARDWEARLSEVLTRTAPLARLASYCYAFGTMLQAGVPLLQSLEVAAEFLNPEEAERFLAARAAYRDACNGGQVATTYTAELCARAEIPSAVKQLFAVGEETGLLDRMALRAAEMLRWEVESRVDGAMELCLAAPPQR